MREKLEKGGVASYHCFMELLPFLLVYLFVRTAFSCVPPVVSTEYNFQYNVTQIGGSLGSLIRVLCTAEPDDDVATFVWQKNGVDVQEPSPFASYLTLRDLAVEDGGQYRCQVTTVNCGVIYSPEISILTPPGNVLISGPSSVVEGGSFQLTCSADGWPPPSYEWGFNGAVGIAAGSVYEVSSATLSDAGEYTCTAGNSRGLAQNSITLTVFIATAQVMASRTPAPSRSSRQVTAKTSDEKPQPSTSRVSTDKAVTRTSVSGAKSTAGAQTTSPKPSTDRGGRGDRSARGPEDPAAVFVVLLALSVAMLVALVAVILIIFILLIRTLRTSRRRKGDRRRLLGEEAGEGDTEMMTEGVIIGGRDADELIPHEKPPMSFVNVAFGAESDIDEDDDEEGEEEGGEGEGEKGGVEVGNNDGAQDTSLLKVSPQRYQSKGSKPQSPSKSQPQPLATSDLPHSVSMDVPHGGVSGVKGSGAPHSRSDREPGQQRTSQLLPPVDRHRVGRRKKKPTSDDKRHTEKLDADKVQLLSAMEESEEQTNTVTSNATVLTTVSVDEPGEEGERRREEGGGRERGGEVMSEATVPVTHLDDEAETSEAGRGEGEMKGEETAHGLEEGEENATTTYIGEVEGEETVVGGAGEVRGEANEEEEVEDEAEFVIQEKIGEASVTFEQEGSTVLLGGSSVAVLSSGGEEEEEVGESSTDVSVLMGEGVRKTGGEGEMVVENDTREVTGEREEGAESVEAREEREGSEEVREEEEEGEGGELKVEVEKEVGKEEEDKEEEEEEGIRREIASGDGVGEGVVLGEGGGKGVSETVSEEGGREVPADETGVVNDKDMDIHRMSVFVEKATKLCRSVTSMPQLDRSHPLTVLEMERLLDETMAGDTLTVEYKTVPHNSVQTLPLTAEEKHKNRYRNVLPNPHSAVRLSDTGQAGSQYINANYIRGYGGRERQYVATQGPTSHTALDFWRMVWEKEVSIIVMTTPLAERGTQKCVKYWPAADDVDTAIYGDMVVRNNYEEVTEFYTTSYLSIYPQSSDGEEIGEERDVYHFWYTAWTDFSVPRETRSILKLREAVDAFRAPTSGPVVVHCSAGLGRSGTFMAIDMGIQQFEAEGIVDPLKYMCEMRQDRGGIIQTADQYIYIHRALKDYITG